MMIPSPVVMHSCLSIKLLGVEPVWRIPTGRTTFPMIETLTPRVVEIELVGFLI
jgi:hypothetical protein